jgi:hypothetical protein
MFSVKIVNDLFGAVRYSSDIANFCEKAEAEGLPASENMRFSNWHNEPASLMYLLFSEHRFFTPRGALFLAFNDKTLAAVSGIYVSDFCQDIVIAGVRAWTLKEYRTSYVHGNYVFPQQFVWAEESNAKMLLLSFNDYNDWLFKFILRGIDGRATAFGRRFSNHYKDFELHPHMVKIKGVYQYVLKKKIDPNFDFDFKQVGESDELVGKPNEK